jgi:hypothetical protein|tara:strand:- start:1923 stop:2066 length:144 start_codon:yes stop_codon:yes gene_type:complete
MGVTFQVSEKFWQQCLEADCTPDALIPGTDQAVAVLDRMAAKAKGIS